MSNVHTGQWPAGQPEASCHCAQVKSDSSGLPEGNQWRYSEFIEAVQRGKVERVRFAKDGTQLQLTAVDGEQNTTVCSSIRASKVFHTFDTIEWCVFGCS